MTGRFSFPFRYMLASSVLGTGLYFGVSKLDQAYVSGPKHAGRFEAQGFPVAVLDRSSKIKDFYIADNSGQVMRVSLWRPSHHIELNGYWKYPENKAKLKVAVHDNQAKAKLDEEQASYLRECTVRGYGRNGFKNRVHELIIKSVVNVYLAEERMQQNRLNVTEIQCHDVPVLGPQRQTIMRLAQGLQEQSPAPEAYSHFSWD